MHKMTKATAIPKRVKDAVFERDKGRCIICGSVYAQPNAHVVRRSQGGMGVEKNIVTLCYRCHKALDEGKQREEFNDAVEQYLKHFYPDWSREDMIYRKREGNQ